MGRSWVLGAVVLGGTIGHAAGVTVYMENGAVAPAPVLFRAERMAADMFAAVGVAVQFRTGSAPKSGGGEEIIEVLLDRCAPDDRDPWALAYAAPYRKNGARVHIFYGRVRSVRGDAMAATVLSHVLAHEITHILEGISRHSASGVLKARWDERDFSAMAMHPLRFAPEDIGLLHSLR
jgi:hypothetical protein